MNPQMQAQVDRAERSRYLLALRAQAQVVCVPMWWHGLTEGAYKILRNGTVSFVHTGERLIAITADHVIAGYLADLERDPSIVCQLGSSTFTFGKRVIDRDDKLDIATFEVSEVVVAATGAHFHAPPTWPPQAYAEGDVLLAGGYPGTLREELLSTADFPFQWFVARAGSVSPQNISVIPDIDHMHQPLKADPALNRDLGGMSGGPLFRYMADPIERLEMVGVISEYQQSYDLMLARPVSLINPDGTLAR